MTTTRSLPMINVAATAVSDLEIVNEVCIVPELTVIHGPERESPAATRQAMELLAAGVPLSLLCDLADPAGPRSADIASSETDGHAVLSDWLAFRTDTAERAAGRTRTLLRALRQA